MKTISLAIPFLVLSTCQNGYETLETHVLTPFGSLDIALPIGGREASPCEIRVSGHLDQWFPDGTAVPPEFRDFVSRFIEELSHEILGGKQPGRIPFKILRE